MIMEFRTIRFTLLILALLLAACSKPLVREEPEPFHLEEATIAEIHRAFQSGQTTCQALVQRYLTRIETYDQPLAVNAIVLINPQALVVAERLDREYADTGELQPLHCIPLIVKDNYDTADMPTAAGSIALKGSVPADDAYMIRVLRESGALMLAKSNMAEWAFSPYYTISSTAGTTRNVYARERVPAGSSGGTASAVAANFGAAGLGSDTGNSIRGPASHTALVGLRPTLGLVSRDGIVPLLLNRDIGGAMTRTVEDTARLMNVIAGFDPADPLTRQSLGRVPADYTVYLDPDGLHGARLGVLRALIDTDTADPAIKTLMAAALNDLHALGAELVDPFVIPDFEELTSATGFCSRFQFDIDNYLKTRDDIALDTLAEIYAAGHYDPSAKSGMQWGLSVKVPPEQQDPPCMGVDDDPRRAALRDAVLAAMDAEDVDALVYPSWNNPPRRVGDLDSPHGNNSPVIAPHSGQPAISVPMGFSYDRYPAGLQFLGRPFSEPALIKFAYAYEQATRHRRPPADFPPLQ
jgi:Asp-tRNA(Asn)/Glu-tRNA(Gln) amidotransferase A subunit family amidase